MVREELKILNSNLGNAFKYALISFFLMFFIPFFGFIIGFFMNFIVIHYLNKNNKENNLNNNLHLLGIFGIIGAIIYSVKTAKDSKKPFMETRISSNKDYTNNDTDNNASVASNDGNINYKQDDSLDDNKIKSSNVVYEQIIESKRVNHKNFQNINSSNRPISPQSGPQNFIIWTFIVLLILGLIIVYVITYFLNKYGFHI